MEKVCNLLTFFLASAQIVELSTPPERKAPTGTSETSERATAEVNDSSNWSDRSFWPSGIFGLKVGCQ